MKTVGEILQKARTEKNLEYEDVEKKTRIRKKFLEAIEENDWDKLPSPTYIKGFIRNYSSFLGLKSEEMVAIFRRQYTQNEQAKVIPADLAEPIDEPILKITPQRIVLLSTIIFIVVFIGYLISAYRSFTGAPTLTVTTPREGEVFNKNSVVITGSADRESQVYINNQRINIDDEGGFRQEVILDPGVNTLTIEAQSKIGKKATVKRTIDVQTDE